MVKNRKYHFDFNRERLLLVLLVAVAFFGFLLWSIEQASLEEAAILAIGQEINRPAENKIIKVTSPKVNGIIKSPVMISGQASTFNAVLQIKIKDASGLVLAQKKITTKESQKMSPFGSSVTYKKPTRTKGTIEVFVNSTKDGSEVNKLTIPIVFKD